MALSLYEVDQWVSDYANNTYSLLQLNLDAASMMSKVNEPNEGEGGPAADQYLWRCQDIDLSSLYNPFFIDFMHVGVCWDGLPETWWLHLFNLLLGVYSSCQLSRHVVIGIKLISRKLCENITITDRAWFQNVSILISHLFCFPGFCLCVFPIEFSACIYCLDLLKWSQRAGNVRGCPPIPLTPPLVWSGKSSSRQLISGSRKPV